MDKRLAVPLAALCAVPFIMVLGNSMLIPVLPQIRETLHLTQLQSGLLITAFSVPAGLVIAFIGILSDRIGRRAVIAPSLIVYGLAGALAGLAAVTLRRPYAAILGARVLQGLGAAGTAPVAMALVGDLFQSEERTKALGFLEAANGLGKVLSPVLGAGAALLAWYAPFFVYAALAVPTAVAVWCLCPEKRRPPVPPPFRQYFTDLAGVFRQKPGSLLACYLAGGLILFTLFGILFYFSDQLEKVYRIQGVAKGLLIALPVAAMTVTSSLTGAFLQQRAQLLKTSTVLGLLCVTAALLLLVPVKGRPLLTAALVTLLGVGNGLALPALNTMVTSAAAGQTRGMVTSLYGAVRFIGVALGPPTVGWLMGRGASAVYWPIGAAAAVTAGLVWWLLDDRRLRPPAGGDPAPPG
ncbi:MAG TPA: MFS transporter [Firmicutes bacterium]|nr:MFS transporter [Bacillota bacterium]